jgi:endonuclease/exonuclease/phosphatase family metal-dependent hydrolase
MKVMTFNIRTALAKDGPNAWDKRRALVARTILDHDPDLVGLQEPTCGQWKDLARDLGANWAGLVHDRRDSAGAESHLQGGFVRSDRISVETEGAFWLSHTPEVAGSVTFPNHWGARTCVWAHVRERAGGRDLIFAVTHFDTHGESWLPSARVVARELDAVAGGLPVVLVGDFNCASGSEAHRFLVREAGYRDAWHEAGHADAGVNTFNAFTDTPRLPDKPADLERRLRDLYRDVPQFAHYPAHVRLYGNQRIDWILIRGPLKAVRAEIDTRAPGGRLPSDHYPVVADLEWT